jgi:flagellar hook-associated protein 2
MATISSPGIGSGIDVRSIVSQLVALEKAPLTQLKSQATSLQTKVSTYGTIKSQVSALGEAAAKLSSSAGWNKVNATSSDSTAIGVTAAAGTAATSLSMEVQQLAKAQSAVSPDPPFGLASALGAGTLTIQVGTGTPVNVVIAAGQDSLAAIARQINDAEAGVSATVLRDASGERLLMRSSSTGEANTFTVGVSGGNAGGLERLAFGPGVTGGMRQTQAAENALATINGVDIVSASNTLTDTVPGLTMTLSRLTTAPVNLEVSADTEAVKANVQAFVDAYNTLNSNLANVTRYDAGTKVAGPLQGDSSATGLQNALRGMMRSITGSTPFTRLADVGIELQTGGTLSIDSEKMDAALSNLRGLRELFSINTGVATTEGFGRKVKSFTDGLLDTDGLISTKTASLQASIKRNDREQERVNDRAARAEVRYLAQYNAMDANVAKLNGLNTFVTQQIALWNNA